MDYRKRIFKKTITLVLSLVLILSFGSLSFAQPYTAEFRYEQPKEIIEKYYPEPKHEISTPAFVDSENEFTSHEEMLDYIYNLQTKSTNMNIEIIGKSQEGRDMPMVIFSKPSYTEDAYINAMDKPIVWLQAQIHGNEPAAGESALAMINELATGQLGEDVLDKITVIVIPRFNVDGSYYFQRQTATKIDSNRDHIKYDLIETINIHKAFNRFMPEVVIDAHEYGVDWSFRDIGKKGSLSYYDILISSAKNLNIPEEVRELSNSLFVENVHEKLEETGFTSSHYYTSRKKSDGFHINEAGVSPRIGRNAYGLQTSFSFLVESRGIGIAKENFGRRVKAHMTTAEEILRTTAENAKLVKETIRDARAKVVELGKVSNIDDKLVIASQNKPMGDSTLKIVDADTGEIVELKTKFYSSTDATPTVERTRPTAYIVPSAYKEVAEKLSYSGVSVRRLNKDIEIPVETYTVTDSQVEGKYYEGHYRNTVSVDLKIKTKKFEKGSYVFTMTQPNANLIAMALEPDAEDSFVKYNVIKVGIKDEVPVYRYLSSNILDTHIVDMD